MLFDYQTLRAALSLVRTKLSVALGVRTLSFRICVRGTSRGAGTSSSESVSVIGTLQGVHQSILIKSKTVRLCKEDFN